MHDFILKEIHNSDLKAELINIGFDNTYVEKAINKFEYKNYKIYNLTLPQANILKQTALSVGADCATHRETITAKTDKTDVIIGGNLSQLEKIATKLKSQPFGLKRLGENILNTKYTKTKTQIVGILNLSKDSFSDGYDQFEEALDHLKEIESADIIEIGAESTRPGYTPVSDEEQLKKLLPILEYLKDKHIISVDTQNSKVAEECLKMGANIINDISGFDNDSSMPDIIAKYNAKIVIQHSQNVTTNEDTFIDDMYLSLKNKIELAISKGIARENIIIDIGIGFGKTRKQNFEILNRIEEFYTLGCPVMVGVSRKSLLNMQEKDNIIKDIYTLALNTLLIDKKVDYIRVHNVKLHRELLNMLNI